MPAVRRATFRAPDPAAVAMLDLIADEPHDGLEPDAEPVPATADAAHGSVAPAHEPVAPAAGQTHQSDQRQPSPRDARREPRHRADRVGNRRPSGGLRRAAALGCASLILGGSAFGAVAASADDSAASVASTRASNTVDARSSAAADELVSAIDADSEPVAFTDASGREMDSSLTLTYTDDARITAQVGYVLTFWSSYNTAEYTVLSGVDCANFASQSLVARGWAMDGTWYYDRSTGAMGPAWSSSTALRDYLLTRTDVATALDDSRRDAVKAGDIAQFDWDDSGDRDHTAVVTRVEHTATGTKVWVGGHTKDADYWDVDEALESGGGSVSYFSLS